MAESVYERVKQRAYEIWESEGRPWGRDSLHWERAHQEITEENQSAPPIRIASVEDATISDESATASQSADQPSKLPAKRRTKKLAG